MRNTVSRRAAAAAFAWALIIGLFTASPAASAAEPDRLAGSDRYTTSVAVAQQFPAGVPVVFVASGQDYPDALSATSAAAREGGPVLLTRKDSLPSAIADEIRRLRPQRVVVLGGPSVVAESVLTRLRALVPRIDRVYGADRYATSRSIVARSFTQSPTVVIATGHGYADGLTAGTVAGRSQGAALLVDGKRSTVDGATLQLLRQLSTKTVLIAGGHGSVSIPIEQQLRTLGFTVNRLGGASRYETASRMMTGSGLDEPRAVLLASGEDFPDALSAATLAARMDAALFLTRSACVPTMPQQAIERLPGVERIAVGGISVVSVAAATNTGCGDALPVNAPWRTSDFTFRTEVAAPYADRALVDVHDPQQALDATGLRILNMGPGRSRVDHPVAYAQYGISALAEYQRTGETLWLNRAIRHAQRLEQIHTERDGAWYFPYLFDWTYTGKKLNAPWWSAMAQGEALSLFVRLHEETGDVRWRTAADATWRSLTQPRSASEPWGTMTDDGLLVFEEYAGNLPPLKVLNGHLFALFGAYDYWKLTGNPDVVPYLDGAATTTLAVMPRLRVPGGVSYYCWQADCAQRVWQNPTYHVIHSWQLDTLARLTGDARFSDWASLLRKDWTPTAPRTLLRGQESIRTYPDDGSIDPPQ